MTPSYDSKGKGDKQNITKLNTAFTVLVTCLDN